MVVVDVDVGLAGWMSRSTAAAALVQMRLGCFSGNGQSVTGAVIGLLRESCEASPPGKKQLTLVERKLNFSLEGVTREPQASSSEAPPYDLPLV